MFGANGSQVSQDAVYVEDVFSTYLYAGAGGALSINNGIDLAGKGGMVWAKARNRSGGTTVYGAGSNILFDTNRGINSAISSNVVDAANTQSGHLTAFNSNGFSLAGNWEPNSSGYNYVSWTFREQKKFFDIVTYTGNGAASRAIPHNLGSVPGCIIIKSTSDSYPWLVYHRSTGQNQAGKLNTAAAFAATDYWANTSPTATDFYVNGDVDVEVNGNGSTYVAYLFAHDAGGFGASGSENVITCGTFTSNSSGEATVTLGYEPQWLLFKAQNNTNNWQILDVSRNMSLSGRARLWADLTTDESSVTTTINPTATGFEATAGSLGTSIPYIYIAIRRGPMKTPTSGTSVFVPYAYTGNGSATRDYSAIGIPTDVNWTSCRSNNVSVSPLASTRLTGNTRRLQISSDIAEASGTYGLSWGAYQNGVQGNSVYGPGDGWNTNAYTYIGWNFRRAPSFMDVVCYTGNDTARTINHNLGVAPELMILKSRSLAGSYWYVYYGQTTKTLSLNIADGAYDDGGAVWNSTAPTSTVFSLGSVGDVNASGGTYVAYLFASCPGVSKVGSYTGTGTTLQINCGFTGGARFVLIKRTDSTGGWYVWDSARGIVAGNDPYLLLNSSAIEITGTDYVDTYSAGFEISSTAPAAINANGGTFIFFAIA